MSPLLSLRGIRKNFFGVEVLKDIHLDIDRGDIMAICGENGAGKSTLMKIVAGIHPRDGGEITYRGTQLGQYFDPMEAQRMGISMIHQELNLFDELTVAQNIFIGREPLTKTGMIDRKQMIAHAKQLLDQLGESIDPQGKVRHLKIAQKQMVEIAKAISFNVELLIMDEPTAVLSKKETGLLFDLIRTLSSQGIAVIYISHRLKEIMNLCHKVTVLRDGMFITTRDVSGVTEREIASLMVGREITDSRAGIFTGNPESIALEVRGVTDSMLKDISFKVRRGEILGFAGLIGAGRSELMEVVFGIRKPLQGEVLIEGKPLMIRNAVDAIRSNIGFVTEDRKNTGLILGRNIAENANYTYWVKGKGFTKGKKRSRRNIDEMIARLSIRCTGPEQLVSSLSGGNQQKVALAKALLSDAHILILDEPTRGVDVGARQEIYTIIRSLAAEGMAVIIVSSDLQEIIVMCERVVVMHEGRITGVLEADEIGEERIMHLATNVGLGEAV